MIVKDRNYYIAGGEKSICLAAEGMVVGRGRQTLAFERGDYPIFFFIFLQQKIICHSVVVFFLRLAHNY